MLKPDKNKITYLILFISLLVLFFSAGGLFVTMVEDSVEWLTDLILLLGTVVSVAFFTALFCSRSLLHLKGSSGASGGQRKNFVFSLILFILIVTVTLAIMNFAASFYTVSWPMSGLHGVSSDVGKKAWLYHRKGDGFVKVNSWGQRDREHTIKPQSGIYRVVFIGDSFLEDGASVPLPYITEEILKGTGRTSYELINLGVSATAPDEYFFRIKKVALPMEPDHCVVMFYAGNDFIQEPSLSSYGGISATYPRWSFLQALGLSSLDQIVSNERRPLLRAWFDSGSLLEHELKLQDEFAKTANDQETEKKYLSFFSTGEQSQLKSVLYKSSAAERSKFYEMLRHPDDAKFRSYYLDAATKSALGLPTPDFIKAEYSFRWVKAAYELCRKKGVAFTLAVIPDGFTVDSKMSAQYSALADMKAYMKHKDEAADRLLSHAAKDGMDVVDLRELLKNYPGAYLNMDGHWSKYGVEIVAQHLAKKFSQKND